MTKAQEMRELSLKDIKCSDELVSKYYDYCLQTISFNASKGNTKCHFWLYQYADDVGETLNEEGCRKFLDKLITDGFIAENTISVYGKKIIDMFEIAW